MQSSWRQQFPMPADAGEHAEDPLADVEFFLDAFKGFALNEEIHRIARYLMEQIEETQWK